MNKNKLSYIAPSALVVLVACMAQDPPSSKAEAAVGGGPGLETTAAPVFCLCNCATAKGKVLCAVEWEWDWDLGDWTCPDKVYDMGSPANCNNMNGQNCTGYPYDTSGTTGGTLLACSWQTRPDAEISSNE
jgi:hypothetical protein